MSIVRPNAYPCCPYSSGSVLPRHSRRKLDVARLVHADGEEERLTPRHLVGRAADCALSFGEHKRHASYRHAELRWRDERWELRDLGSTNGTFLNKEVVPPGRNMVLSVGDVLAFGDPTDTWEFVDDTPPGPWASSEEGGRVFGDHFSLTLGRGRASAKITMNVRGQWMMKHGGKESEVHHGSTVTIGGEDWTIHLPDHRPARTVRSEGSLSVRDSRLEFSGPGHDEATKFRVEHPHRSLTPGSRSFVRLLFALALRRKNDVEAGQLSEGDCGWIERDELARQIDRSAAELNVLIHRARRWFESAGFADAKDVIEVRRSSRSVRLGIEESVVEV